MASRRLTAAGVVVAAAAVAALLVVLLGHAAAGGGSAPANALVARAQLTPSAVEFGDELTARVVAVVDARQVDAHRLVVADNLAPLTELGPTTRTVTQRGRLATVVASTPVACLTQRCVNDSGRVRLTLPAVHVSAPGHAVTIHWPVLTVHGRVTAADLQSTSTALRADASPPAVTYRISSGTLALLLDVLAGLLAAVGAAAIGREALQLVTTRRRGGPDPLARALVYVREAETRPAPDRRRALELLDRVLGGSRDDVRDLAWSEPEPTTDALASLVDELQDGDGKA